MAAQDTPALDRRKVNNALILLLFGGPIVVLDITIGEGGGPAIDIVNDALGFGLILWALALLGRQPGPSRFHTKISVVAFFTFVTIPWSIGVQISPELHASLVSVLFSTIGVLGLLLFCTAMREFSSAHRFPSAAHAWQQATLVVLGAGWVMYLVTTVAGRMVTDLGILRAGTEGTVNVLLFLGLAAVITLFVFIVVAIGTTRRELRGERPVPAARTAEPKV